jgi:hypothetical protein
VTPALNPAYSRCLISWIADVSGDFNDLIDDLDVILLERMIFT